MNSHLGKIIYNTIQIINQFPNMPTEIIENGGIEIGASDSRKTSLSFKPISSSFNHNICGGWTLHYKYDLIYQCASLTNDDRLNAIDFLSSLTHWLVGHSTYNGVNIKDFLPVNFEGGSLDQFVIDGDVTLLSREVNGIETFHSSLQSLSSLQFESVI